MRNDAPRKMPFGKHKGKLFEELPDDYLQWLLDQDFVDGWLRRCVLSEVQHRQEIPREEVIPVGRLYVPKELSSHVSELISAGYKELAKKYHPDRCGGSGEQMTHSNLAKDWLNTVLRYHE